MRKFFQKFRRDSRGAVTVFVTLLLIPAVLVSGTGVDLTRIYAAESIVQDANQLAANSALASYDALLQDLYGLFGFMAEDPEFASMMNEYIETAVFGVDPDTGLGTFQLFYGSNLRAGDITPAAGKNLENPEVLRRQIEEYAKFRAPVIIIDEVLGRLEDFKKVQEDADIISQKIKIDDKIEEIDKLYEKIYECIQEINTAEGQGSAALREVNSYIDEIENVIEDLHETRASYTEAARDEESDVMSDYETKYRGLLDRLEKLITGGTYEDGWIMGNTNDSGGYESGGWITSTYSEGLQPRAEAWAELLRSYISNSTFKDDSLDELVSLCEDADRKRAELARMVDDLEDDLDSGKGSESLRSGLTEPNVLVGDGYGGTVSKSTLEVYKSLVSFDLGAMADAVMEKNGAYLSSVIAVLESVCYEGEGSALSLSTDQLKELDEDDMPIDLILENEDREPSDQRQDLLEALFDISPRKYQVSGEFEKFQSSAFSATHNPEFYQELLKLFSTDGENKKKDFVKSVTSVLGDIQSQFTKFLEFDPAGAYEYRGDAPGSSSGEESGFGEDSDWGDEGAAMDEVETAMGDDLLSSLGDIGAGVANRLLLLTYATEMFSCYTTSDGEDEAPEENMNGIPMSVDVNYFFQSELEYLYNGNPTDALANLKTITGMIFLVRFVFNYVASFVVKDVVDTVSAVQKALAATGPVAIVVGELVRLAMALGESVMDVSRLKDGQKVTLFKSDDTWKFSLEGILDTVSGELSDELTLGFDSGDGGDDPDPSMGYKDYLRLFLLLVDENKIAERTAWLIELNVTNKREDIGSRPDREARESAMAAVERFDMAKAVTDFSITTTVDLRMLFLSMPFAQKGVNGVIPRGTVPIAATDYRGY